MKKMATAPSISAATISLIRPLNHADATELAHHEGVIDGGVDVFIEVGMALRHIRDGRLYRGTHATFEAYCLERWKLSKTHVNRQIKAADVADDLAPIGVKATHEAQLRPLASLSPEARRTVWKQAVKQSDGQQPTASQVEVSKRFVCGVTSQIRREIRRRRKASTVRRQPPLSPNELVEKRERELIDYERNAHMRKFADAIHVLSKPTPDFAEVATDILAVNVPDWMSNDWVREAEDARHNLTLLLEELQKISLISARSVIHAGTAEQ